MREHAPAARRRAMVVVMIDDDLSAESWTANKPRTWQSKLFWLRTDDDPDLPSHLTFHWKFGHHGVP